jgi:hypothetical protein
MTPLFDEVWELAMGRHSDTNDPTIPTPDTEEDDRNDVRACGYPINRAGPDWPAPAGALDTDGNPWDA